MLKQGVDSHDLVFVLDHLVTCSTFPDIWVLQVDQLATRSTPNREDIQANKTINRSTGLSNVLFGVNNAAEYLQVVLLQELCHICDQYVPYSLLGDPSILTQSTEYQGEAGAG